MRDAEDHSASVLASQPLARGLLGDVLEALTSPMQMAREEELVGVPQRQLRAKVDKEQERTRR